MNLFKLASIVSFLLLPSYLFGQEKPVDLNSLIEDTIQSQSTTKEIKVVWWLPFEFWESIMSTLNNYDNKTKTEFLNNLKQYTFFAIVDGKATNNNDILYSTDNSIRPTLSVFDKNNVTQKQLTISEVDPTVQIILSEFKPAFKKIMGEFGENFVLFVYNDYDSSGQRIFDPKDEGTIKVHYFSNEFLWNIPLKSMIPMNSCPLDSAEFSGKWVYCPFHGEKLIHIPRSK